MLSPWTTLRFIVTSISCLTVVECQKSQHLVLSEARKTGLEGTLLQVNCTAHGTSTLDSLKWIPVYEGQPGIQQSLVTNTTVVMTISSLQGSDAGRYKCLLVMTDGTEETAEFELMVRRKEANSAACIITQFKCKKTKHCIFLRYRCDGKDDCGDGSDEDCESNPCLNKFRCNNSRCIDNQEVCNHIDNCGDLSDEGSICFLGKFMSTTQPATEDNQFGWLKITMSTVIASTVGAVILISFIVIVVFRVKMKRQREQRIARALEGMYRHGESREATSSGHGDEAPSDQRPFLPSTSHHYGNIIVNVNNGVQYLPGYDYSLFVAVPPPYSECSGGDLKSQPPPYSTIDRSNTRRQTCVTAPSESQGNRQTISLSSVQNCLAGARCTENIGAAASGRNDQYTVAGNPHANNGQLYPGGGQVQELESLSGITPSFLQSLLGSHCEALPDQTDGYRNSFQPSPAPLDGWPHILQARIGVINSDNLSRQAPSTTSSSTQTSQHKPLLTCRISPGVDTEAAMQSTHRENIPGQPDRFITHSSQGPHIANIENATAAEPDIPVGTSVQIPVGTSAQIPVGTPAQILVGTPAQITDGSSAQIAVGTSPQISVGTLAQITVGTLAQIAVGTSAHFPVNTSTQFPVGASAFSDSSPVVLNSPCTCSSFITTCRSDVDDLSVPLLACSQEESLSANAGLVRRCADILSSNNAGAVSDHLLLMETDTTPGCTASVNKVSCESRESQPRPRQQLCGQTVVHSDDTWDLLVSAASTSSDHGAMVRDENTIRLVSHELTHGADVPANSSAGHSSLLQNEDASRDLSSANSLTLQPSSIDQSLHSSLGVDAVITTCESSGTANSKQPCSGELNVHNGNVVLEVSKHTTSSQILGRLHDVYAAEQRDMTQDGLEPVVNIKRPVGVVTRPALPKFNSDFVLPYRHHPL